MRSVSRWHRLHQHDRVAYARCKALLAHGITRRAMELGISTFDPATRRRAASLYMRALAPIIDPAERDVDAVVANLFGAEVGA